MAFCISVLAKCMPADTRLGSDLIESKNPDEKDRKIVPGTPLIAKNEICPQPRMSLRGKYFPHSLWIFPLSENEW
ncbi:MAG: hypothetical protein INR69_17140 [Mucilaginibacter polytrichastri]|nr:hypothetical protein [Mucilaginibacter polytrichastri]